MESTDGLLFADVPCKLTVVGHKELEFETRLYEAVQRDTETYTLIYGIYRDGKFINFEGHLVDVTFDWEGKTYTLNGCLFKKKIVEGKSFYYVDKRVPSMMNKRKEFRLICNASVGMQPGDNKSVIQGVLRDVSFSGLSFTSSDERMSMVNEGLSISVDIKKDNRIIKTQCIVVRVEAVNSTRYVVGCRVIAPSKAYTGFIAALQQEEARRKRGY